MQNPHAGAQDERQNFDNQGSGPDFDLQQNNQGDFQYEHNNPNGSPNKPIKLIFGLFLFLGVGTLVYGFFSLNSNIKGPFKTALQVQENIEQESLNKLVEMQNKDTDEDGLSDYDEEYVYGTSAYLFDTDSDGFGDKQEIDSENDPLCPMGVDCRGITVQDEEEVEEPVVETPPDLEVPGSEVVNTLQGMSVEEIRAMLLDSGSITKEELDQIDDETLIEIFNETLNSDG